MRFFKVIFIALLFFAALIFFISNKEVLGHKVRLQFDIHFHNFQSAPIPFWILLLFVGFLGALTVSLFFMYEWFKHRQAIRSLKHNLEILSSELANVQARQTTPMGPSEAAPSNREVQSGPT